MRRGTELVRRTLGALPDSLPVAVTADASTQLILALLRAGAGDVIDLALEGAATARAVVQRICQRQRERSFEIKVVGRQREIIEELLKDLIRTERRTIDVEEALAAARTGELANGESRAPAILLIEHERRGR
jgi:hypothetical protein